MGLKVNGGRLLRALLTVVENRLLRRRCLAMTDCFVPRNDETEPRNDGKEARNDRNKK
jgi:hypothetical protein